MECLFNHSLRYLIIISEQISWYKNLMWPLNKADKYWKAFIVVKRIWNSVLNFINTFKGSHALSWASLASGLDPSSFFQGKLIGLIQNRAILLYQNMLMTLALLVVFFEIMICLIISIRPKEFLGNAKNSHP